MPENRGKTGNSGSFQPGKSGNPGGRPRMTDEQRQALEDMRSLAPEAVELLRKTLQDEKAAPGLRLKAALTILDRTYGKANTPLTVDQNHGPPPPELIAEIRGKLREYGQRDNPHAGI